MADDNVIFLEHRRASEVVVVDLMVEIRILEDGTVTVWLADRIETAAQFNWAIAKLAGAGTALLEAKGERTGEK